MNGERERETSTQSGSSVVDLYVLRKRESSMQMICIYTKLTAIAYKTQAASKF